MQSWSISPINPPIKIPATINPINTHGSIPIKTHYQPNQNPSYCRFAGPTHQVPKSFATASFLSVVRSGLPIDLNEPPPCVVLFGSRVSWVLCVLYYKVLSFYDDHHRWDISDQWWWSMDWGQGWTNRWESGESEVKERKKCKILNTHTYHAYARLL